MLVTLVLAAASVPTAASRPEESSDVNTPWPLLQLPVTLGGGQRAAVVDITSYGGIADGHTDNAPAFARALAQLERDGGGTLVVPRITGGNETVYASMPIIVNISHITLRLDHGVRLLALCNISEWPTRVPWDSYPAKQPKYYSPFVHALNVTDFVLDGGGVIDGQGSCWWKANCNPSKDPACRHDLLPYERPRLVVVEDSQRVSLANFTAINAGFWTIVLFKSSDIHVRNVTVRNPSGGVGPCPQAPGVPCYGPNTDGIDIVSVTRALVERMDVSTGDDCFCVKSGEDAPGRAAGRPSSEIRVRNNIARKCSNPHQFGGLADAGGGFKIGSDMSGGVENVLFEDNTVGYAGMAMKVSTPVPRGGRVHNITFQRIDVMHAGMVIAVDPLVGSQPGSSEEAPLVANITFRHVIARNVSCIPGAVAYGCKQHNVGWIYSSSSKLYPLVNLTVHNVTALAGDPTKPLTWDCSEPGTVFGEAIDVTPPLTCLGHT
jgi:polygalacturonase